jgi:hypothetical protein
LFLYGTYPDQIAPFYKLLTNVSNHYKSFTTTLTINVCLFVIAASEDAPSASSFEAMDPERRRWLEEAISSMTVDVVKQVTLFDLFITLEQRFSN